MLSKGASAPGSPHSPSSAGAHTKQDSGVDPHTGSPHGIYPESTRTQRTQAGTQPNTASTRTEYTPHTHPLYLYKAPRANTQTTHTAHTPHPHSDSTLPCCFETALSLPTIIVVIRSSHKGRVTDGDKLAGKKAAMLRYLKKRRANTSNLRKANHFIWEVYKKKKTEQYLTERQ